LTFVSGLLYNTPINERGKMNYQKYTWVCTGDCDALIEYTIKEYKK